MFGNLRANYVEAVVATIVLLFSAWQAIEAFATLYPYVGHRSRSSFSPLEFQHGATLGSDGGCLGYIEGSFARTLETSSYTLKGEVFLTFNGVPIPTTIDMEASFNILGQLAAAVLRLSNSTSSATLGWLNIDPVELSLLSVAKGASPKRNTLSIPGPLLLKDLGNQLELEYVPAGKRITLQIDALLIKSLTGVSVQSDADAKHSCLGAKRVTIDLEQLRKSFQTRWQPFLPQIDLSIFSNAAGGDLPR